MQIEIGSGARLWLHTLTAFLGLTAFCAGREPLADFTASQARLVAEAGRRLDGLRFRVQARIHPALDGRSVDQPGSTLARRCLVGSFDFVHCLPPTWNWHLSVMPADAVPVSQPLRLALDDASFSSLFLSPCGRSQESRRCTRACMHTLDVVQIDTKTRLVVDTQSRKLAIAGADQLDQLARRVLGERATEGFSSMIAMLDAAADELGMPTSGDIGAAEMRELIANVTFMSPLACALASLPPKQVSLNPPAGFCSCIFRTSLTSRTVF